MNYNFPFTIVNATERKAPSTLAMQVSKGRIVHMAIYFPLTANDLVHVQVDYHGSQLFPANPEGYYTGDITLIDFPDQVLVMEAPFILNARGWGTPGADCTVYINITVVPFPILNHIYPRRTDTHELFL